MDYSVDYNADRMISLMNVGKTGPSRQYRIYAFVNPPILCYLIMNSNLYAFDMLSTNRIILPFHVISIRSY